MKPLITWRYFLIPKDKFNSIKPLSDELDGLRNRELSNEESTRKELLIEEINEKARVIALKIQVYKDDENDGRDGTIRDGTIIEELIYRMDESWEVHNYSSGFYFQFLVYATPEELQKQKPEIEEIFKTVADHHLLKKEFLGKWIYLDRAREIFGELRKLYNFAFSNECGIIKTDQVTWKETEMDLIEEEEKPGPE